jgi:nitrogen regulatory protein PII-like uncharacterized protein
MTCALCQVREANKKNTHYLTDGIIRSCLNQDGSGEREKGFYFDLSNNSAFVEFNFQRETSISKLEESLGRKPTDEEIENAKEIPFSVDYVFCSICENLFTSIESNFIENILPKFRESDLNDNEEIEVAEFKEFRLFFYLQLWRTHICEQTLKLPEQIAENLRQIILTYETVENEEIYKFPLSIIYLQTLGGLKEYTTNFVGFTNDKNPYLILMNDFIIQFFESNEQIRFFDFHGLNTDNYKEFVNQNEEEFKVKIIQNEARKQLLNDIIKGEKVKQTLKFYTDSFNKLWFMMFGGNPPIQITQEYINEIIGDEFEILKYSKERIIELTREFILKRLK